MQRNRWYNVPNQSLAIYARNAGFDLAVYDDYSKGVQEELRRRSINEALYEIEYACEEQGFDFASVKDGVYVISLGNPLSIQYRHRSSQVIYIGIGNIKTRIKSHLERSLFDVMQSLSGSTFDFSFARPGLQGAAGYYKHVEYKMLEYFCEQYGGLGEKRRFPLLNKNAGSDKGFAGGTEWWKKPLKASGKKPRWKLSPTSFSEFAPLDAG